MSIPPLPPRRGKSDEDYGIAKEHVMCSLRLPAQYLDVLRRIAREYRTSNGGAVMLLVDEHHRRVNLQEG